MMNITAPTSSVVVRVTFLNSPLVRSLENESDAGRDDGCDERCPDIHGDRVPFRITPPDHLGSQHAGFHGRVGNAGARDAPHQGRKDDVHLGEASPHVADQHVGEIEQPARDAGAVHEVAGQDEHGHCQQRKILRL